MSTTVRGQSWAGDPPHADAARARLLDATNRCIAGNGLRALSVAAVASEAGVSRPTVYRYFEGRDELIGEALTVAADGLRAEILTRLEGLEDPAEMLVEAIVLALGKIPNDPVLRAVWDSTSADPTVIEQFTRPLGVAWARDCLKPAVEKTDWTEDQADEAMEIILRLALSFLVSPTPRRSDDELRDFLRARVVPGLQLP